MKKNEIKEKVNKVVDDYCILFDSLCKRNRNKSFRYYSEYMNKLSGIFDLLVYDDSLSIEEYVNFHKECLDKLKEVYNEYK